MKKILIMVGSIAIAGAIAFYTYNLMSKESVTVEEVTSENDGGKIIEIKEKNAEPVEEEFPVDMPEYAVQNAIHSMSHQKVEADDKWGFLPITEERITRLLEVVKANEYEHSQLYADILTKWSKGDFSSVHHDHNDIWDLQNGTIGEATGILSAEKEKEFIEEHFDIE